MGEKDDYLTTYRVFFENFAATVDPEDQLPVNIAGYTITEAELPGEVIYWTTQYLTEKKCPLTLMAPLQRIILDEVRVASKKHPNEFGYNSDDSEYIALRLMQAVTARVNDVCLRYLDNSRLDTLPPPPPMAMREYRTVSSATKNIRRVMEDRHVEIGNLEALFGIETTEPTSFYAVYDGHAGSAAATYCAAHLHQYLVESQHFTRDLRQAVHDAYLRTDAEFVRKSNQKRASGGSTAVSIAVRGKKLVVAWAGDSLALLAKRMSLMQLVNPHKPDRADERERIESTGGKVMYWGTWRVNGQLAVSRAIGDAKYKPYVTATPEIAVVDLDGDEDFVVVACDGLWDVVSEDAVAFSVYKQLMNDSNDLKAVPKNLIRQAKKEGSEDNISIIVVFLKDPRDIVADNCPPMDLGLDNAVVNAPPFAVENEACKMVDVAAGGDCAEGGDNGVSDSDSDDLGPETAVDADLDIDEDAEMQPDPAPPTPPAHAVEQSHVDGNLVDNVAESGEESEDEWNYYKGEGEREQNPSEEADEPPRSETPCQDNSAWESSSADMNSSPLNPDAPVFVPGSVTGSDVLLAESPRKPMPMDDIDLLDVAQFQTEAVVRPAELQDLDNCDQLNGHHNVSVEGVTEHLNGNVKCEMESLGFGFNVGIDEKVNDSSLIQDFERIQKDTTDFCNIQVFQSHAETNPFSVDGDDELFERLKNKERDPMSMSFYQEKDDDTCERFSKTETNVDLNAVQPLPDSDDEDIQANGINQVIENKENVSPGEDTNLLNLVENVLEPNNDIMRFEERSDNQSNNVSNLNNFMDFNVDNTNNMQNYANTDFEINIQHEPVAQTDTPESHKLLFEQIPEIPDGKSSELGFANEDVLDPSESEKDIRAITPQEEISQDIEMESKLDESPSEEIQPEELKDDHIEEDSSETIELADKFEDNKYEQITELAISPDISEHLAATPELQLTNENIVVDVHENPKSQQFDSDMNRKAIDKEEIINDLELNNKLESVIETPEIRLEAEEKLKSGPELLKESLTPSPCELLLQSETPLLQESPVAEEIAPSQISSSLVTGTELSKESPVLRESPLLDESSLLPESIQEEFLLPQESSLPRESPLLRESPLPQETLLLQETLLPQESPLPEKSPLPQEELKGESPLPQEELKWESPVPKALMPQETSLPRESPFSAESPIPPDSPLPQDALHPQESPLLRESPLQQESTLTIPSESPVPSDLSQDPLLLQETPIPSEALILSETLNLSVTANQTVETSSPFSMSPLPTKLEDSEPIAPALPSLLSHFATNTSPIPQDSCEPTVPAEVPLPRESPLLIESPLPHDVISQKDATVCVSPLPTETVTPIEAKLVYTSPTIEPEIVVADEKESQIPADQIESVVTRKERSILEPETEEEISETESSIAAVLTTKAPLSLVEPDESTVIPEVLKEPNFTDLEISESQFCKISAEFNAPAPDIVPEERMRTELVTDIDIGIPESRAQEICVPVTNEIQHDDSVQPGATPPPTPAVEPAPIAAATAAVAATAAAATAVVAAAKAKTSPKKLPTTKSEKITLKSTLKTTASPRTPTTVKRAPTANTTPKSPVTTATRAPVSASKTSPAARLVPKPANPAAPATTKPAPKPAAPRSAPVPRPSPATRAPPKAAVTKTSVPKPTPPAPTKTTALAAPKPTATRPAPISRPPAAATKPREIKPKAPPPAKPAMNGDVKTTVKPPARTSAPAPRAAPRPTPRPVSAAAPTKPAAPKAAARIPLDKQSKDLANKRITAKSAPPRTATTKAPVGMKGGVKKSLDNKKEAAKLSNGTEGKAPPSPPADALLPDVIA